MERKSVIRKSISDNFNACMIYEFNLTFKTGFSKFSVFINGSMYEDKLKLAMSSEKKSFKVSATIWSSSTIFFASAY